MDWTRIKNNNESEMPYVPDRCNWETDFFVIFGIFLTCGGGGPNILTPFGTANFLGYSDDNFLNLFTNCYYKFNNVHILCYYHYYYIRAKSAWEIRWCRCHFNL